MIRSTGIVAVVGMLACAAVVGAQAIQPERLIMVREADKPAQKCRVLKCWKDKDGNKVCQVQVIDSGEMMTILEPDAGGGLNTPAKPAVGLTKVFRWGTATSTPPLAPAAPADAVVVGMPKQPAKPSNWDRLFASSRPRVSTQSQVTPVPTMDPNKPIVVGAGIEPTGKPRNGRDSWGTVERISEEDASAAVKTATAKAEATEAKTKTPEAAPASRLAKLNPFERKPTGTTKVESKPKTEGEPKAAEPVKDKPASGVIIVDTPDVKKDVKSSDEKKGKEDKKAKEVAGADKDDGSKLEAKPAEENTLTRLFTRRAETAAAPKPEDVNKVELPPRMEPVDAKKTDARPAAVPVEAKGEVSLWTRVTGIRKPMPGSPESPPSKAALAAAAKASQGGGPGSASWNTAATTPPAPTFLSGGISLPASAKNAFTVGVIPGSPAMQPMPMISEAGVSTSLNNAFTNGGSPRPIPSDMGRNYDVPNGLQGGGEMGGAERRPPFTPPTGYAYAGYPAGYYYPQPMMMPVAPQLMPVPTPASVVQASMTVQAPSGTPALQTLRDALLPSEREMAVDQLVHCDWKRQPEVAEALTKAARTDPAPTVRAACVRGLAKMKCNTVPVVAALVAMKNDSDLRVRQEVEQALNVLMRP